MIASSSRPATGMKKVSRAHHPSGGFDCFVQVLPLKPLLAAVVLAIFVSALVALGQTIERAGRSPKWILNASRAVVQFRFRVHAGTALTMPR
jgi:hypothetical protein